VESVEKVAEAVLYEGYLLYPYRRTTLKNQQRWTFGGVYPRAYSEASSGDDPWLMQTQCLVVDDAGVPGEAAVEVKVRFLHVVDRLIAEKVAGGAASRERFVEALRVGEQVYRPWEEAVEREIVVGGSHGDDPLRLSDLSAQSRQAEIAVPEGRAEEPLIDPAGGVVGALVREWRPLRGAVEIAAEPLWQGPDGACRAAPPYRLTVRIVNTTPWQNPTGDERARAAALRHTFVSTHTILRARGGEFVSLLEPPAEYQEAAGRCENVKTWPVLAGEPGDRHTVLSSPIILYDYPQVSPQSPGNLFDGTEIDELLTLSILTLTDEEKQEMRESDARAREILERTESLTPEQLMQLHGVIRRGQ
jgi:hypothetical protein